MKKLILSAVYGFAGSYPTTTGVVYCRCVKTASVEVDLDESRSISAQLTEELGQITVVLQEALKRVDGYNPQIEMMAGLLDHAFQVVEVKPMKFNLAYLRYPRHQIHRHRDGSLWLCREARQSVLGTVYPMLRLNWNGSVATDRETGIAKFLICDDSNFSEYFVD